MNLQEFGQKIKKQYPQYESVDDVELAKKVIEKYPVYKRGIDTTESTIKSTEEQTQPEGVVSFPSSNVQPDSKFLGVEGTSGVKETIGNIPGDLYNFAKGLLSINPLNAAKEAVNQVTKLSDYTKNPKTIVEDTANFASGLVPVATRHMVDAINYGVAGNKEGARDSLIKMKDSLLENPVQNSLPYIIAGKAMADMIGQGGIFDKTIKNKTVEPEKPLPLPSNQKSFIKSSIEKVKTKTGEIFKSGKELKTVEKELASQPMEKFNLQGKLKEVKSYSTQKLSKLNEEFNKTTTELKTQLAEESQTQSSIIKGKLKTTFRKMTETYGKAFDEIETDLSSKGKILQANDFVERVVKSSIEEAKNRFIPEDNPTLQLLKKVEKETPDQPITLKDLRNLRAKVSESSSSAVQSGNKYAGFDDQVTTIFLKKYGDFLGEFSPELKALNESFGQMANARSWAMRNFKPFNEMEIQKGANILTKISKGDVPDKTIMNYMKMLEEGNAKFEGAGNLTNKTIKIGNNLKEIKQSFEIAKKNLVDSTDFQINKLQTEIAELQKRGIELGQRASRLKELIRLRNTLIGLGISAIAFPQLKKILDIVGY